MHTELTQLSLDGFVVAEVVMFVTALCLSTLMTVAWIKVQTFHVNMRLILIYISLTHVFATFVCVLTRISNLLGSPEAFVNILAYVRPIGIWTMSLNTFVLFFERIAATFLHNSYERLGNGMPWLALVLIAANWFASVAVSMWHAAVPGQALLTTEVAFGCGLGVLLVFSFMPCLTYWRYKKGIRVGSFSLSQRYQLAENYQSAKLLTLVCWNMGCLSCAAGIIFIYTKKNMPDSRLGDFLKICAYNIQGITHPLIIVFRQEKMRRLFCCGKFNTGSSVQSLNGTNMIVPNPQTQSDMYFQSYKAQWT